MFDIPRTKDPDKWVNDVAMDANDFMTNTICGEDINDFAKRHGVKAKWNFKDGKAYNLETGEVVDLKSDDSEESQ